MLRQRNESVSPRIEKIIVVRPVGVRTISRMACKQNGKYYFFGTFPKRWSKIAEGSGGNRKQEVFVETNG